MTAWELSATVLTATLVVLALKRFRVPSRAGFVLGLAGLVVYVALRLTCMTQTQAATTVIFLLAYGLIASERIHKTTVALGGAAVMLLTGLIDQHEALHGAGEIEGVDWNTIFLLISMMIIVNITRHTGVFQWLAIKAAKVVRGEPVSIIIVMCAITAVLSALLDNVTTVLLIAPVAILVFDALKVSPVPCLICVVLASNIGGTATLIGDPPNIMIASSAGIPFTDFLRYDGPPVLALMIILLLGIRLVLGKRIQVPAERKASVLAFDESKAITDIKLLRRALVVISLTLLGFFLHSLLGLEPGTVALGGAALLLLLHHGGPEEALHQVEWSTIFFFIGLFIMVGALVKAGVVAMLGQAILTLTSGNLAAMTLLVLWFSAVASGIVDNIPFVATMAALIHSLARGLHPEAGSVLEAAHAPDVLPLWWALSLGACLGGNFTLVGASANVVVAGLAGRSGHKISFARFMKYGVPATLVALVVSTLWLWLRFLR